MVLLFKGGCFSYFENIEIIFAIYGHILTLLTVGTTVLTVSQDHKANGQMGRGRAKGLLFSKSKRQKELNH